MEQAVKERLVGAALLVLLVVIIVPSVLTGPPGAQPEPAPVTGDTRVVEIDISRPGSVARDGVEDPVITVVPAAPASAGTVAAEREPAAAVPAEPEPESPEPPPASEVRPPPAAGSAAWAVQVAALSSRAGAAKMTADLKGRGYAAFVIEHRADGKVFYRVRVGPEAQRVRADALAARLKAEGLKATVVSHP